VACEKPLGLIQRRHLILLTMVSLCQNYDRLAIRGNVSTGLEIICTIDNSLVLTSIRGINSDIASVSCGVPGGSFWDHYCFSFM